MTNQAGSVDFNAIKMRQKATWGAGDYGAIGGLLVIVAEQLCEAVDLRAGQRVLDVATGTGNTAIAAARRFCHVTGVDYAPELLERAAERAAAEHLEVEFREGDAEALPFPDGTFDTVLSSFGAMFAPNHEKAAAELLRVCRPGGTIGMTNWTPDGFAGDLFRLMAGYVPPPPEVPPAALWGTEDHLRTLWKDGITELSITRRSYQYRFMSPEHFVAFYRANFGPMVKAMESLDDARGERLTADLAGLVRKYNRAQDGTAVWPGDYLEVVATRA